MARPRLRAATFQTRAESLQQSRSERIADRLGYLPISTSGGALLFHLLSKLHEKTSIAITTNLSFGQWANVFGVA